MVEARTALSQLSSLTAVVANEAQEALSQLVCLRKGALHLTQTIQLPLGLWAKLPWAGQHPPDALRLLSRLGRGRVRPFRGRFLRKAWEKQGRKSNKT